MFEKIDGLFRETCHNCISAMHMCRWIDENPNYHCIICNNKFWVFREWFEDYTPIGWIVRFIRRRRINRAFSACPKAKES